MHHHRSAPRRPWRALCLAASLCIAGPALAIDAKASRFYEDALTRYEKRDLPGAIIQLKNALQIDKNMLPVQLLLGQALLANGEVLAAEVALQEAVRLGVNRAEVVVPLAQANLALGRHRTFLEQPLFALAGLPVGVQVQVMLLRASALSDLGDSRAALQAIADAAAAAPGNADVWLAEVPVRIRARQFREADAALAKAAALAPQSAELHYQRGAVAHVQGDVRGALAAYDQALKADPRHVESLIARAGIYLDLQRGPDAGRDLAELNKLIPGEPRAAYLRAVLARRDGQAAAVRAALKQVTDTLDPVPLDAIRYRPQMLLLNGMAHYELGGREKARSYLEALARVQPQTPAAKLLAQIYLQDKDAERAASVLESYLRAQPQDSAAMTLLASALMVQGRSARAITLMQESLRVRDLPQHQTMLGLGLLSSGQADDAVAALESAWRKDPGQPQAGVALAGLYLRRAQPQRAVAVAEVLAARAPQHAGFQDLLGMALAQSGKPGAARDAFERAIALDPAWPAPQLHLARVEIAQRDYDAADARLNALLKKDDKSVDVLMELSLLAAQRGQAAEQLRWLVRAADHASRTELRPGLALVDLHLRQGRVPQALEASRALSAKAGDDVQVALAQARALLASNDAPGARTLLSGASRTVGYAPGVNLQIAALQMQADHRDGAAYSLEKALSSDPSNLQARAMQVDLDLREGQIDRAEKRAREISQQHPKRAIGHTLLGDAAQARGQTAAAVEAYRRAFQAEGSTETVLRLFNQLWGQDQGRTASKLLEDWLRRHPDDLQARRTLADGYAAGGQFVPARGAYEALLKQMPNDAGAANNLANVLLHLKDPGAVAQAERAVALAPTNAQALDTLGWALFQSGEPAARDRALQLLRDARLREPGSAEIRYHLAAALAQAGRQSEARDEVQAALDGALPGVLQADARKLADSLR